MPERAPEADAVPLNGVLPQAFYDLRDGSHELPRYQEQYYHPLGRNAAVDAVLADPLYLPVYGRRVSQALRDAAVTGDCHSVLTAALIGGGYPAGVITTADPQPIPGLADAIGEQTAAVVEAVWAEFLTAYALAEQALAPLSDDDRAWLLEHPDAWFFGEEGEQHGAEMSFFTTDTAVHLRIFRMAAEIDLAQLAEAQRHLAVAIDLCSDHADALRRIDEPFSYEHSGITLLIAGPDDDRHTDAFDLLIDVGGDDIYENNAGGTAGDRPAALLVDLDGDDRYEGTFASQGAGILGVGALADLRGADRYEATHFAQGAAYFGSGMLVDLEGDDSYRAHRFAQGAAAFGSSLLWDNAGNDSYMADGMAQAASTTLGIAFLVESWGDDDYTCGGPREEFWSTRVGIGQGGASGVRDYPWKETPSFYGGVGFLDDAQGNDTCYVPVFGLGGAYVFGLGVHINTGGDDQFIGKSDTLGATIHLAAGLFIKDGGDDIYDAGWGSIGVGGDRGVGIFIDTGGDDSYRTVGHSIGTSRKPKAVGLFVDVAGNDRYDFSGESCAHMIRPSDPENWSHCLFMDLGGTDEYPEDYDGLGRSNNRTWRFADTGVGVDARNAGMGAAFTADALFGALPQSPRAGVLFDPINGTVENITHRPLITRAWPAFTSPVDDGEEEQRIAELTPRTTLPIDDWIAEIPATSYDRRRQLYEMLDLARFTNAGPNDPNALVVLLAAPANAPADQLAFAGLWCELDESPGATRCVGPMLMLDQIHSPYARRIIIRMIGVIAQDEAEVILIDRLHHDDDAACRRAAAKYLGKLGTTEALTALTRAAADASPMVRVSACQGLRDSTADGALEAVVPLLDDENLYVHRAAAVTAVSLGFKPAVDVLLESMKTPTLDTGENYGHNLYATLSSYLGPELLDELGLDLDTWKSWWDVNREAFDLDAALRAKAARDEDKEGE